MITTIVQSYFTMLLSVGIGSSIIFIFGIYLLFKTSPVQQKEAPSQLETIPDKQQIAIADHVDETKPPDISAIAGDDRLATQLDLARAYIETDKHLLAKNILSLVLAQGSAVQQQEAQQLLSNL